MMQGGDEATISGVRVAGFCSGTGYGEVTTQHLNALEVAGVPLDFWPLSSGTGTWGPGDAIGPFADGAALPAMAHRNLVGSGIEFDTLLISVPPHWLERCLDEAAPPDVRRVVHLAWETDRLAPKVVPGLQRAELVLANCEQNAEAFRRSGVTTPVKVVGHLARIVATEHRFEHQSLGNRFCFFVLGTWSTRKGIEPTIRAFLDAFTADDNVSMMVKTAEIDHLAAAEQAALPPDQRTNHGADSWWSLARILRSYPNPPPVFLMANSISEAKLDALHQRAGCFVSMTHGEGWGLGAFDAGLHDRPVIISRFGAPNDWLTDDWPLSIDYHMIPARSVPLDSWTQPHPSENWAQPHSDHASSQMRWVYENQADSARLGRELGDHLRVTFGGHDQQHRLARALARE